MSELMAPRYDHTSVEKKIYQLWEKSGYFNPDNLATRNRQMANGKKTKSQKPEARSQKPFCIIMPPPNANGLLHSGHALFITLQDIITRFKRMQGYKTLWLPGADHAGFETQIVYEKKLEKEGRSRFGMDPKKLYDEILKFTLANKKNMESQVRRLGASCDWSREKFTLDPDIVKKVQQTFVKMYKDGLIYRGKRPVNWCTKHQTSLSDVETVSKEIDDALYYLKYGPITVATVRPETIFGDVAIAVNPKDKRYKEYIGKTIEVKTPANTLSLKVIGDESVEMDFGTGALKITPAHDANDFALAERHKLPLVEVIDQFGKLNDRTGKYQKMKMKEARAAVVTDLEAMGLIAKKEEYKHGVPVCYKCETVIEPRVMDQWFVKMKPLAELAIKAAKGGKIQFIPERFKQTFLYWMENTIDWNISRQIVWGIQIPAWYRFKGELAHLNKLPLKNVGMKTWRAYRGKVYPSPLTYRDDTEKVEQYIGLEKPGGEGWIQDPDTFDTWFSSGQWPLLTLGFPDGGDFKNFYPTDVMETGYDLIFRWVPRMVIFGLYLANEVPFRTVYLHGLVNDLYGKKMSKSKGNVVDPMELTVKYGTDALRMALVVGNPAGSDMALSEDKIRGYRNFSTKIWNAARFILMNKPVSSIKHQASSEDKKDLKELAGLKKEIKKHIEDSEFHLAAEKLYHYFWHTFADKIIEATKPRLKSEDEKDPSAGSGQDKAAAYAKLETILLESLKILHPFMPFVTEEIYQKLGPSFAKTSKGRQVKLLMVEKW